VTARKKYKDFETAVERLEEITDLLEAGETSLEDSIKLYTEGLEIARWCDEQLSEAEKKIKVITEREGRLTEENFDTGEEA
jgi:exodeoxyribonuclease VII small subunit